MSAMIAENAVDTDNILKNKRIWLSFWKNTQKAGYISAGTTARRNTTHDPWIGLIIAGFFEKEMIDNITYKHHHPNSGIFVIRVLLKSL